MSSPSPPETGQTSQALEEKPRLTDEEKKANHIASEKKRRQAIRDGFDRLSTLVPGLEGQARSEGTVLFRTVDYLRELLERNKSLRSQIAAAGGTVDPVLNPLPDPDMTLD